MILSLEDGPATLDNQLYMYVGKEDRSATASVLARNGLDNGKLYAFRSLDARRNSERTFTSDSVTGDFALSAAVEACGAVSAGWHTNWPTRD